MTIDTVGAADEVSPVNDDAGAVAGAPDAGGAPFEDGKAVDAFRTIGEVAQALGIRTHVLRYWEEQFPMLRPTKRSGGRRYYRGEDVELIRMIDRLVHREGYTLRGARQFLEGGSATELAAVPADAAHDDGAAADPSMLARLKLLRAKLADALAQA